MAPRGTPIAVFNLPVTAHGYSVASPAHQRTLNAVDFTIRPETATVFGFRLASPAADALLTLTYDLVSQQLSLSGATLAAPISLHHPLVNNALRVQVAWTQAAALLTVDGATHRLVLADALPPTPHASFFADAGMVQVTQFTAWYAD